MICVICERRINNIADLGVVRVSAHVGILAHVGCAFLAELFGMYSEEQADWPKELPRSPWGWLMEKAGRW